MKPRLALWAVLALLLFLVGNGRPAGGGNVVDQFHLKFWNGSYYAMVKFPNGQSQELKSATDLNFAGWQAKIKTAWEAIQNPPVPPEVVTLEAATKEQLAEQIKKLGLTAEDLGLAVAPK
jgi:hypothetical protein